MEQKTHYKMYKAGRQWLFAAITLSTMGFAGVMSGINAVSADDTATTPVQTQTAAQTETPPPAATTPTAAPEAAAPAAQTQAVTQKAEAPAPASVATPAPTTAAPAEAAPVKQAAPAAAAQPAPKVETATQNTTPTPAPEVKAAPVAKPAAEAAATKPVEKPVTEAAKTTPTNEKPAAPAVNSQPKSDVAVKTKAPEVKTEGVKTAQPAAKTVSSTAHVASEKKTDDKKAASRAETTYEKSYIFHKDVDSNNKLETGKIYGTKTIDGKVTYFAFDEDSKKMVEIKDEAELTEIKEANEAGKVTRHYLPKGDDSVKALEDAVAAGAENVGDYLIVSSDKFPENVDAAGGAIYEKVTRDYKHPDDPAAAKYETIKYAEKDGQYYLYNEKDGKFTPWTDSAEIIEAIKSSQAEKTNYASGDVLLGLFSAWKQNPQGLSFNDFMIHATKNLNELPKDVQDSKNYQTDTQVVSVHYAKPDAVQGQEGYTVYQIGVDGLGGLYKYVEGETELQPLSDDERADYEAAQDQKAVDVKNLPKDKQAELEAAVDQGETFIMIDGNMYRIQRAHNAGDVPADAAEYLISNPSAETITNNMRDKPLTKIVLTNPGVKVSLLDYWITTAEDKQEYPTGAINMGINKDHTLKFSTGSAGNNPWNKYNKDLPYFGIVRGTLGADGFPVLNNDEGESLAYLFNDVAGDYKAVWGYQVEQPMFESDGKGNYTFISDSMHADYNKETGLFEIYNMANTPNNSTAAYNGEFFPLNEASEFFDFETGKPRPYLTANGEGMNHYFGLTMETDFVYPPDGVVVNPDTGDKEDMIFTFSGDDDFWLYVDDKLVLDLGGIHDAINGRIDFSSGEVSYSKGMTAEEAAPSQYLSRLLGDDWNKPNEEHTMKIFYMERGNNLSHMRVAYNLQIPDYYYASRDEYARKDDVESTYVYGTNSETRYEDQSVFYHGEQDRYGVRLTENTKPTPPDPEKPDPGKPDPEKPEPETPEPETPEPETPEPETPEPEKPEPETPEPGEPDESGKLPDTHSPQTPKPEPGKPAQTTQLASATPQAKPVKTLATPVAKNELPQTGNEINKSTSMIGLIGLVLSLLGLSGVVWKKRRGGN